MLDDRAADEVRAPWQIPDAEPDPCRYRLTEQAVDTDADGLPDTQVSGDLDDLVLATDLDGDGLADRILEIGRTGEVRELLDPAAAPGAVDGACTGIFGWVDPDPGTPG